MFLVAVFPWVTGCGSGDASVPAASIAATTSAASPSTDAASTPEVQTPVQVVASQDAVRPAAAPPKAADPEILITTTHGEIRVRLNQEQSPLTVDNFLANYVERGFYDETIFHYVESGFMIAGGGYTADLQPKETRAYIRNEARNGLKNKRGTIAMVRHPDHPDSATSQFFINLADNPSLDFKGGEKPDDAGYCVFGEVIQGLHVVDRIAQVSVVDKGEFPKTPVDLVVIRSIRLIP
jgi:cyclophilin family peptidyl-prolyl cis-trans isomerase